MEELLDCMICFEAFVDPKILNCGHTYCCKCLEEYHKTNRINHRKQDPTNISCPTCRENTPWPEKGAQDLKADFKTLKIQDLLSSLRISSSTTSTASPITSPSSFSTNIKELENCAYCLTIKKNNPSYVYCIACEKSYCRDCQSKHRENPVFGSHSTINISRGINGSKYSGLLSNNCEIHQKELLKYVCVTCNQAVCTLCLMNKHQQDDVKPVDQFLKNKTSIIKNLLSEVRNKKYDLKKQLEELEPSKAASEKACLESENLIKKRSEILIKEIKIKEAELLTQIEKVKKNHLLPVQKEIERLKFHLTKVKGIEEMANDKKMTLSKCLIIYPVLIQRMQTLLEVDFENDATAQFTSPAMKFTPEMNQLHFGNVEDSRGRKVENSFKYEISPERSILKNPIFKVSKYGGSPELKSSATNPLRRSSKVELEPDLKPASNQIRKGSKGHLTPENNAYENPLNKNLRKSCLGFSSIKLVQKIYSNGNQHGELFQAIWLTELGKNMFAVSDCGNKRIQIFQTSGKVVSVIDDHLNPMGIAVTSKRNLIITDCVQQSLQVFSPDGKYIFKVSLGKFSSPCDVAVCPNGETIVSDLGNKTVSLYNNEFKRVFTLGLTEQENMSFKEPRYVTSGPNNEIVVSDCKDHKVKVFDSKGQLLTIIGREGSRDGELSAPNGVCYYSDDLIVIADTGNNRLSTFSKNGTFLANLKVEVVSPRAVCKVGKSTLVVSEYDSTSNISAIKIFDML